MSTKLSILAISGSLRTDSSNNAIINRVAAMAPVGVVFNVYNGLDTLPHFNPGLDNDTPPVEVSALREKIKAANAVLICTPEYAFGVPGSLKNALDWTVSSGEFVDKPVALITASSVGTHAHAALLLILGAISAKVSEGSALLIPFIRTKVNSDGIVTDAQVLVSLQKVLDKLLQSIDV